MNWYMAQVRDPAPIGAGLRELNSVFVARLDGQFAVLWWPGPQVAHLDPYTANRILKPLTNPAGKPVMALGQQHLTTAYNAVKGANTP